MQKTQNSISSAFLTLVEIWQRPPSSYSIDRRRLTLKETSPIRIKNFIIEKVNHFFLRGEVDLNHQAKGPPKHIKVTRSPSLWGSVIQVLLSFCHLSILQEELPFIFHCPGLTVLPVSLCKHTHTVSLLSILFLSHHHHVFLSLLFFPYGLLDQLAYTEKQTIASTQRQRGNCFKSHWVCVYRAQSCEFVRSK